MSTKQEFFFTEMRIENFRSLEDIWVPLRRHTVLIGENNSGKTSFLDALSLVFLENPSRFSVDDFFLKPGETQLPKDRKIRVDLRIEPFGADEFSDEVRSVFSNAVQLGSGNEKDYVALRAEFAWDKGRGRLRSVSLFLARLGKKEGWRT